jgi:hypothetical protein
VYLFRRHGEDAVSQEGGDPMKPSFLEFEPEEQTESVAARASMPFAETSYSRYLFQRDCILQNAPESSGVYGLFNAFWIFIGETDNLRTRLLEHLAGDDPCIVRFQPSGFAFELASPIDRRRRNEQLIKELQPLCNTSHNGKVQ